MELEPVVVTEYVNEKINVVRWLSDQDPAFANPSHLSRIANMPLVATASYDGETNALRFWQLSNGKLAPQLVQKASIAFDSDLTDVVHVANGLVYVATSEGEIQSVDYNDISSLRNQPLKDKHSGVCSALARSNNKSWLVSVGHDGKILHIDLETSKCRILNQMNDNSNQDNESFDSRWSFPFNDVKTTYDNSVLTVNEAAQLQLWDIRTTGGAKATSRCDSESSSSGQVSLTCIAIHHSQDEIVATGSTDGVIAIWDKRNLRAPVALTQAHNGPVWEIAFRPGYSHQLYTCSEDGMLLHWNCKPSQSRDDGAAFRMSADGSEMTIVNMLSTTASAVNSLTVFAGILACGSDSETVSLFLGH